LQSGIIQVKIDDSRVTIIGKEWDYSKGSRKGSNQTNAKEFTRITIDTNQQNPGRLLSQKLFDLTTSYHCDNIMKWINQTLNKDVKKNYSITLVNVL